MTGPGRAAALVLLVSTLVAGCTGGEDRRTTGAAPDSAAPSPTASPRRDTPSPSPRPSADGPRPDGPTSRARRVLGRLTLPEQVGQLLMVGIPAGGSSTQVTRTLASYHVGNIFLKGRSAGGIGPTADVVRTARRALEEESAGVPLLVATDQEGGRVQVLSGPGFSRIPAALVQGSWSPDHLQRSARRWAGELRAAGVDLDLAPVADVVPSSPDPRSNAPVGAFDRQFGATVTTVRSHALAFARGMSSEHVGTAVKHFPGLGHVRSNTDTTSGVLDDVVGRHDPGLAVFRDAAHGTTMVMVSTATYQKLDPSLPAAFSPTVVQGLLRGRLGYSGVVVSDDLGDARQVQGWTPGRRAGLFLRAGGDLALTVEPSDAAAMTADLLTAARQDAAVRALVRRAALRVLLFKARLGLLRGA